jgi:hypothetical protein
MSPTIIETEVVCRAIRVCYLDVAQIASSKDDNQYGLKAFAGFFLFAPESGVKGCAHEREI